MSVEEEAREATQAQAGEDANRHTEKPRKTKKTLQLLAIRIRQYCDFSFEFVNWNSEKNKSDS